MTTARARVYAAFSAHSRCRSPEGCEGWESMYPYYALFSDERRGSEEARGWFRDGMHFPEPMFPFDFITADSPYMGLGQANYADLLRPAGARHRSPGALRMGVHERQSR